MNVSAAIAMGRRLAESKMTSSCTITRAGIGKGPFNHETGTYDPPARITVYVGRCKVQDNGRSTGGAEAGEVEVAVDSMELHLPVESNGYQRDSDDVPLRPRRDDVARIDSNPLDEALVGGELIVQAPHSATAKTARRLPVEAVH